jgi:hypothetical protein
LIVLVNSIGQLLMIVYSARDGTSLIPHHLSKSFEHRIDKPVHQEHSDAFPRHDDQVNQLLLSLKLNSSTRLFKLTHRFSIGFRSGDRAGHPDRTFTIVVSRAIVTAGVTTEADRCRGDAKRLKNISGCLGDHDE